MRSRKIKYLRKLGRKFDKKVFKDTLMFGLPAETLHDWQKAWADVERFLDQEEAENENRKLERKRKRDNLIESATEGESTTVGERATFPESTIPDERAKSHESTTTKERTRLSESAKRWE